ncbi:MAG: hypothetical protein Kow0047_05710 [Anaerolineae bacterium]
MMGFGLGGIGLIFMAAFWAAVIGIPVWLLSKGSGAGQPSQAQNAPLDVARRRYASGEITKEEYEELRRTLQA